MTPRIVESDGSIFDSGCAALVSPVDAATGAQGKGLAKLFAMRFPDQCAWYKAHARKFAQPGDVYCVPERMLIDWRPSAERPIVLFVTTKDHYRYPSQIGWIVSCCAALVETVQSLELSSIALPAIGCGEGGLDWAKVRPLMLDAAARMQCERVMIYAPK